MLAYIEIFLSVVACLGLGAMYAITGYEITNLLASGPNWRPWEQVLLWLVWPVIIPLGLCVIFVIFVFAVLLSIFIAFVTTFDIIKSLIKKLIEMK